MEAAAWKQLFESLRPEDQECLVVSVEGGLDVAVQAVAKVEDEVVLLRGRVSGQADVGRIFVIPYDRLNCLYVNRYVQVEETELFSPSVSLQRKQQIAKMVQAMKEKAREEAQAAEASRNGGTGSASFDVRKQLEELREKKATLDAQNANLPKLPGPLPNAGVSNPPTATPSLPARQESSSSSAKPGRFTLPKHPREDRS